MILSSPDRNANFSSFSGSFSGESDTPSVAPSDISSKDSVKEEPKSQDAEIAKAVALGGTAQIGAMLLLGPIIQFFSNLFSRNNDTEDDVQTAANLAQQSATNNAANDTLASNAQAASVQESSRNLGAGYYMAGNNVS